MARVLLKTYDNIQEAHIAKGMLENEGIPAYIHNENFSSLMPVYNNMMNAGVALQIDEVNEQRAKALMLDDYEKPPEGCLYCGSQNIGFGLGQQKGLKLFFAVVSAAFGKPMANIKNKYYCKDCKREL